MKKSIKKTIIKGVVQSSLILIGCIWLTAIKADVTADCNTGTGVNSTECGVNASASAESSTAVGESAAATAVNTTAVGKGAQATKSTSTALGQGANATGSQTTAVGALANATAVNSSALGTGAFANGISSTAVGGLSVTSANFASALGNGAWAHSVGAVSIGFLAGRISPNIMVTDSPQAIVIGNRSVVAAASPGAIAIGGDVDDDGVGATATAIGAIAIGADVVADIPNTLVTNVPIIAKDISGVVVPRTMFEIQNSGNTKFNVTNTDASESWAFANPGTGFRLSRQGSGSVEFEVKNNGNAVLAGTLTENSDINAKQDIVVLDQQVILDKVMGLDISEWRYKDDPNSKHIGPMAQDFYQAFELGDTDKGISTLDSSGVALAAIQAIKNEKDVEIKMLKIQKQAEIQELKDQLSELRAQVAILLESRQ